MKALSWLIIGSIMLLLGACAPAAPATTAPQAPAQKPAEQQPALVPSLAAAPPGAAVPAPTVAPAQPAAPAAQPTQAMQATAQAELKPPVSGGVLNPPTLIATPRNNPANIAPTLPANWGRYQESATGLTFQYPRDWPIAVSRSNKGTIASLALRPASRTITNAATILIDVRPKQGDWLAWLRQQLPAGRLLVDAAAVEGGPTAYAAANAQLAGRPAVFVFAPAHANVNPVAALHIADDRYFYQFTYLGAAPDSADQRAIYWRLLNTALLSNTTPAGVQLPSTTFTTGLDINQLK